MIFFDGIYKLDRKNDYPANSSAFHNCSWRIQIIAFNNNSNKVRFIKPYALIVTPEKKSFCQKSCAEYLVKRICSNFNLKLHQTIWIEYFPNTIDSFYVASFTKKYLDSDDDPFYSIKWRSIHTNELTAIRSFLKEV